MNAIDQLNSYLQRLEKRLRFLALSKGTSLVTVSALVITVLLVWIINRYAFSPASLLTARIFLFLSVAVAIAFGLVIPLLHLNRRNAARKAEQKFPEFQERLLTLAEKPNAGDPFSQLLAADTMRIAESSEPERLAANGPIFGFLASAAHRRGRAVLADKRWSRLSRLWNFFAMGRRAQIRRKSVLRYRRYSRRPHRPPQRRPISHRAAPGIRFAQGPAVRAIPRHFEVGASGHAADTGRLHLRVPVQQPGRQR